MIVFLQSERNNYSLDAELKLLRVRRCRGLLLDSSEQPYEILEFFGLNGLNAIKCAAMMQSSTTKSPTITVFRLRSDRTMLGSYIPLVFSPSRVAGFEEDRLFKPHATTTNTPTITTVNGTASGARDTEVATTNKSDYIYLTQSTDSRALLVTRFPLDDLGNATDLGQQY